jgi:hypothetical protein
MGVAVTHRLRRAGSRQGLPASRADAGLLGGNDGEFLRDAARSSLAARAASSALAASSAISASRAASSGLAVTGHHHPGILSVINTTHWLTPRSGDEIRVDATRAGIHRGAGPFIHATVVAVDAIGIGDAEWRLTWGQDPLLTELTGTVLVTPTHQPAVPGSRRCPANSPRSGA